MKVSELDEKVTCLLMALLHCELAAIEPLGPTNILPRIFIREKGIRDLYVEVIVHAHNACFATERKIVEPEAELGEECERLFQAFEKVANEAINSIIGAAGGTANQAP